MSESEEQLKRMVMTFRVSELQMLLGYAGKNKTGRKNELQSRALDIVRMRNTSIHQKIKELYKSIQLEMMSFGDRGQGGPGANAAGILTGQRVPGGMNAIQAGYPVTGNLGVNSSVYNSRSSASQVTPSLGGYTSLQASHNSYPISPDVRLKKLPFYDLLGELLKPSTLAPHGSGRYQEANFSFSLTPQQANKIAHSRDLRPGKQDYTVQVQMRFCLLETTCEQEDNFPPNINVKINDKMCPLPSPIPTNKQGVEPKRPPRPVNVTALCKISPTVSNRILVSWSSDYGRCYVISVYLVQRLTSEDLLHRLKSKGPRLGDFTKSLIKQKLREDGECEIATTSLRCSLLCPLGKMRMVLPCRSETCNHLQCFDASLFLQMNERKPTWTCPVCDKPAIYDNLVIDGYFQDVLQQNASCSEVSLNKDGTWTPLLVKKEEKVQQQEKKKSEVVVETLIDFSDDSDTEKSIQKPDTSGGNNDDSVVEEVRSKRKNPDVEIITLSDSDDETAPPPSKKPAYQSTSNTSVTSSTASNSLGKAEESENSESAHESANGSWCIGEVDPGKRLIFRKSGSSAATNNGTITNNGVANSMTSPGSSGSASPQIICLDSPANSPSPPNRQTNNLQTNNSSSANPSPSLSTSPTGPFASPNRSEYSSQTSTTYSSAPQMTQPSGSSSASSITSELRSVRARDILSSGTSSNLGNPIPSVGHQSSHLETTSVPSTSPSSGSSYMLQDPFSMNHLVNSPMSAYNTGGLQNIFNPMSVLDPNGAPPTTSPNLDPFGTQDRFL